MNPITRQSPVGSGDSSHYKFIDINVWVMDMVLYLLDSTSSNHAYRFMADHRLQPSLTSSPTMTINWPWINCTSSHRLISQCNQLWWSTINQHWWSPATSSYPSDHWCLKPVALTSNDAERWIWCSIVTPLIVSDQPGFAKWVPLVVIDGQKVVIPSIHGL